MTVIEYVCEEVTRQNHDITKPEGIERVGWMLDAWVYAVEANNDKPTYDQAIRLGQLVERHKNALGLRTIRVRVGDSIPPSPQELPARLSRLFSILKQTDDIPALDFYRMFEEIHPFVDGNGRTGKILLNWLNRTLMDPIFPPQNFWGDWIRNP